MQPSCIATGCLNGRGKYFLAPILQIYQIQDGGVNTPALQANSIPALWCGQRKSCENSRRTGAFPTETYHRKRIRVNGTQELVFRKLRIRTMTQYRVRDIYPEIVLDRIG